MTTLNPPVFTSGSIEMERFPDVAQMLLISAPTSDNLGGEIQAILKLTEGEALEVGLMLIRAHHQMQEARLARGERREYSIAEIEDAHTIADRYPRREEGFLV